MGYKRKRAYKPYTKNKKRKTNGKKNKGRAFRKNKRSLNGSPRKTGTSHWNSYAKLGYNPASKYNKSYIKGQMKLQPSSTWVDAYGSAAVVSAGVQGVANLYGVNTPFDFKTLGITTNGKLLVEAVHVKVSITNQQNSNVFIDLYDIEARDDTTYLENTVYTPLAAFASGMPAGDAGKYGVTPFDSDAFTQTYKVNKITKLNLASGETAVHEGSIKQAALFTKGRDAQYSTSAGRDIGNFKGWTKWTMMIIKGPASDADNTTVGPLSAKVDFIVEKRYRFQTISADPTPVYAGVLSSAATKVMETDGDENLVVQA